MWRNYRLDEVEEAYEKMDIVRSCKSWKCTVPFPIYATSKLDKFISGSTIFTSWSTIVNVDLQYCGAFLADPLIETHYIPGVLEILEHSQKHKNIKTYEFLT
jgi:hypothetical protein